MMFDEGFDRRIKCRFISDWFKIDSYVSTKEKLMAGIEKNRTDVVVMDLDLYKKMVGIETSRRIRNRFDGTNDDIQWK
jgi:DNA-binding NarL/FixJ family response regulator